MIRFLYTLGLRIYALLASLIALRDKKARLWVNGRKNSFRLLKKAFLPKHDAVIWIHAASLGEFEQGRPLIEQIKKDHPNYKILLTFFSPSGYEVRKNYELADCVCYLPLDTRANVRRFLQIVRPQVAIFIKYEFWYNYIDILYRENIPIYSVSSIFRPSQIYFRNYGFWFRQQICKISHFFVQNEESATLLQSIGISHVSISGDTRFDRVAGIAEMRKEVPWIDKFKGSKKMLIAGSTWLKDEEILAKLIPRWTQAFKFIIVPHEIDENHLLKIELLVPQACLRYSKAQADNIGKYNVIIMDKIGLLSHLYQYADIAYIGGGFGKGIHNLLEPACFGIPVAFGPRCEKFQEAQDLITLDCAKIIHKSDDLSLLLQMATELHPNYTKACENAAQYIEQKRGATDIILKTILTA